MVIAQCFVTSIWDFFYTLTIDRNPTDWWWQVNLTNPLIEDDAIKLVLMG